MKKIGFTLAEALLVLAVIGVVAALTIPQIVSSAQKKQAGAILAKSVKQIETGLANILQQASNNIDTGSITNNLMIITLKDVLGGAYGNYDETKLISSSKLLFSAGAPFFGSKELSEVDTRNYFATLDHSFTYNSAWAHSLNKTNVYIIHSAQKSSSYENIFSTIVIDTNGAAKPNKKGKDLFAFGITSDGKLIPAGTQQMKAFSENAACDLGSVPIYQEGCKDGNITNGWSCTARVVTDGWKITY